MMLAAIRDILSRFVAKTREHDPSGPHVPIRRVVAIYLVVSVSCFTEHLKNIRVILAVPYDAQIRQNQLFRCDLRKILAARKYM